MSVAITYESEIHILSIEEIGIAEIVQENEEAQYPCKVTWCSTDIDAHVAEQSEDLRHSDDIEILGLTKSSIVPGIYIKLQNKIFQKAS